MRIISKFHDYYDSVMKQGMDNLTIYQRDQSEIIVPNKREGDYPVIRELNITGQYYAKLMYIGFCGQIFPAVKVIFPDSSSKTLYSFESLKEYLQEHNLPMRDSKRKRYSSYWYYSGNNLSDYEHFFNNKEFKNLPNIFTDKNIPIFTITPSKSYEVKITLNPCLKDYNFYNLKDPFTCYQEIYMFCSGVLRSGEKEMVTISNQDRIDKHGFDKWSFRKKSPSSSE